MATKADLAKIVLKKLKSLDPEETPEAADSQDVQDGYDRLYQELLNDNLVNWTATENIPVWAENPVADILAYRMRKDFYTPMQDEQALLTDYQLGIRMLRRHLSPAYVPESRFEYY